jgi:radical SAM superfamily enzyme YgiQ (UPF0313 family)
MKILLCRPIDPKLSIIIPNLGLGYLSSALKRKGKNVDILDCVKEQFDLTNFEDFIRHHRYDVIGIQILSCDYQTAKSMFSIIKREQKNCTTIAGGPHVSALPDFVLHDCPEIDYAITGEAENAICTFCDCLESQKGYADVPNLVYRSEEGIRVNAQENPPLLDQLAFPDWEQIDPRSYPPSPHGMFTKHPLTAPIITSRGCPYECTYCNSKLHWGRILRKRSPENIIAEIELLYNRFGVREIHIEDDNFTFDRARAVRFCELLKNKHVPLSWACPNGVRLDRIDKELLDLMESSGCYSMAIGIESGSEKILKNMKRHITLDEIKNKVELIRKHTKIRTTGFFIIGYPGERKEDIKKTIRFAQKLPLHRVQYSNFIPLPGTSIFNILEQKGDVQLNNMAWSKLRDNYIGFVPHGLSRAVIQRYMKLGFLRFYGRPKIIMHLIREIHSWRQFKFAFKRLIAVLK